MKLILVTGKHERSRALSLGLWTRALLSLCLLGLPLGAGMALGYALSHQQQTVLDEEIGKALRERVRSQQNELHNSKSDSDRQLQALAVRMADLQARLVRLDALGERVADQAKLDTSEFNFASAPAVGGPETAGEYAPILEKQDFMASIDRLTRQIDSREQQFDMLEEVLVNRKVGADALLGDAPVHKGWISSYFGWRHDPFTGRRALHEGIDFAGREGTAIVAVASGVVTLSGEQNGYGKLIELNHGDGYSTRYAHSKLVLVRVGDAVKKGQVIALMGSSGRSTAPHVHFEVHQNGHAVDPAIYLRQASRWQRPPQA